MAEYTKDTRFSIGWVIGGTILMMITNIFGGFLAIAVGVGSIWTIAGIALVCFALGGFVIGWQSEGQTILEAGIAAVVALVVTYVIRNGRLPEADPEALLLGFGIPFLAALLGGWLGEKVQGDTITTSDD